MAFAAILEHAGFLERLMRPVVARAKSRGSLILAVNASGISLNVAAGDQYVADVLPARMYRDEFEKRGAGVLGVSTVSYLPYCFFNLLSPVLDVAYGFLGFKVPSSTQPPSRAQDD
jgi:NhaC family Na+:H+ antiporter